MEGACLFCEVWVSGNAGFPHQFILVYYTFSRNPLLLFLAFFLLFQCFLNEIFVNIISFWGRDKICVLFHLAQKCHKFLISSLIYFKITTFINIFQKIFRILYCPQVNNILFQEDWERIITWIYVSNPLSFLHCFILIVWNPSEIQCSNLILTKLCHLIK